MATTVQKIVLWREKVAHRPGALAAILEPLAAARADLQVVMGYREHGSADAVIEVYPIAGKKVVHAAKGAGLSPSAIPAVLVRGDNRSGLGHRAATALADAGLNIAFLVTQTVGRRYSAVFGFETAAQAEKAVQVLRKATRR